MSRRIACAAAGSVLLALSGTATAAPAAHGRLAADTTVTWTGTKGIRLVTSGQGSLPEKSMTLTVRGGTYAFVTMLSNPQPRHCVEDLGIPNCYGFFLAHFPTSGRYQLDERPGHDHVTRAPLPPAIMERGLDLYLMTDGAATLRLRPSGGHTGRTAYVAGGRIRGLAQRLPDTCSLPVCGTTAATRVESGGATFDFGRASGQLVAIAYSGLRRGPDDTVPPNHPQSVRNCFYPNEEQPGSSPDPAAHPHGCDAAPNGAADTGHTASENFQGKFVGGGYYRSWLAPNMTGRRYVGYATASAWTEPRDSGGYGIWFNYGIR